MLELAFVACPSFHSFGFYRYGKLAEEVASFSLDENSR
jgi:hypothetical protein